LTVTASEVKLIRNTGQSFIFTLVSGVWQADADINYRLDELKDTAGIRTGWQVATPDDSVETYSLIGDLSSITDHSGITQTLTFSDATTATSIAPFPGLLIKVTDNFGRSLNFAYNSTGQMSTMADPSNNVFTYSYDANGNLSTVTYPDDTPMDSTDNPKKTYLYGEAVNVSATPNPGVNYTHALTGITDENGVRYGTYKYDATGLAVSTEHTGGIEKYSLNYAADGMSTTVTDPLGSVRTTHLTTVLGVVKPTGTDQPLGSGCGPASSAISYDGNGNVAARTDFNGHTTCHKYDLGRNLETARVEGLTGAPDCTALLADGAALPPNARKVSTDWHPSYRLPMKIAEPKRLTSYTRDAAGNALTKTERATNDFVGDKGLTPPLVNTPARVWTYSYYAPFGQVHTVDGPRSNTADVVDRTSYSYYPHTDANVGNRGNLKAITNALGQVTTIDSYNGNGQPTQITAANKVKTSLDYFPRGWLKTVAVTAADNSTVETSQYDYYPTGLLKTVTQPDKNVLTYKYDDAHRLTSIEDSLHNKVTYTLDRMGNRLKETYWDPSSAALPDESVSTTGLRSKITRVYDALNRLQTLTTGGGQ
jgi:YD repeat-containing protein